MHTLSALDIAEQMTFIDQKILFAIHSRYFESWYNRSCPSNAARLFLLLAPSSEFLSQSWTKSDKEIRAPGIHLMTKRFNDVSILKCTENGEYLNNLVIVHFPSTDVCAGGVRGGDPARCVVSRAGKISTRLRVAPPLNIAHCFSQAIEKWTAVADICRCLHNFNGVLQICSAFTSASAFRLKSTWAKISKSVSLVLKI